MKVKMSMKKFKEMEETAMELEKLYRKYETLTSKANYYEDGLDRLVSYLEHNKKMNRALLYGIAYGDNLPIQKNILGVILLNPSIINDISEKCDCDKILRKEDLDIFNAAKKLVSDNKTVDAVTIMNQMKEDGTYSDSVESYMAFLMTIAPNWKDVDMLLS